MHGVDVLKSQVQLVQRMLLGKIDAIRPAEWAARPSPGINMPGYTLWHMVATPDWVVHAATRGLPEMRAQGRWAANPAINPPLPPFGCTQAQADTLARSITPDALHAYATDVHAATLAWLESLSDADLDGVPDLAASVSAYRLGQVTANYAAEVSNMTGWNVARFFSGPCTGHLRGHFGELEVHLALLRA